MNFFRRKIYQNCRQLPLIITGNLIQILEKDSFFFGRYYHNLLLPFRLYFFEVRNSRVTKSSYETELRKMASQFELLTRKFLKKFFYRITNSTSQNVKLNFELLPRKFNFYFSTFELPTQSSKMKSFTSSF